MRSTLTTIIATSLALAILNPVQAMPDKERLSIEAMGDLNGVALICRYSDEAKRLKLAMIETLPKVREYGALFDSQTNLSFLAFTKQKQPCPSTDDFANDVDGAIAGLKSVFK